MIIGATVLQILHGTVKRLNVFVHIGMRRQRYVQAPTRIVSRVSIEIQGLTNVFHAQQLETPQEQQQSSKNVTV